MKDTYKLSLLHNIKNQLSVDNLIDLGLSYSQIATFISQLIEENFLDKNLQLTEKGNRVLEELSAKYSADHLAQWIQPNYEYKVDKIGLFDVYLPRKNK